MSLGGVSHREPGAGGDQPPVYRVRLLVSGIRCASEGAPLERALRKREGVRNATVSPLLEQVWLEVDRLSRLEKVIPLLVKRGYSVDMGDVGVTIWIPSFPARLQELARGLLRFPGVVYCQHERSARRLQLGLAFTEKWEKSLRVLCTFLRRAVEGIEVGVPEP